MHDLMIDWLWTMGMQNDDSASLIQNREEGVKVVIPSTKKLPIGDFTKW